MITDNEVMRIFERADPAQAGEAAPAGEDVAYLDAVRTRNSYVPEPGAPGAAAGSTSRQRWRTVTAVAAAGVLVIAGALVLAARGDPADSGADRPTPPTNAPDVSTTPSAAEMVRTANAFVHARNSHDVDAAMALVGDDGVTVQLCWQSLAPSDACINDVPSEPVTGQTPMDRDTLVLALEAEALYGVRYRSFACEATTTTFVRCSFRMDSRLRRIAGLAPVDSAFDLSIAGGRIRQVAFPWLNIGFDPEGYHPSETEPFLRWLERRHPGALDIDQAGRAGTVFRTQGQELYLDLTRPSLDLLGDYLDEYELDRGPQPVPAGELTPVRLSRTVAGVSFSLVAPASYWMEGPVERLADATEFRSGRLYVSTSRFGPQGAEAVVFWTSFPGGRGPASPCDRIFGGINEPSASELAAAVATAPGTEVALPPAETTLGGRTAVHVQLSVRDDRGCDPGYFFTWRDEGWGEAWTETNPGDTIDLWVVDVAGELVVFEAETAPRAGPELARETRQIVDSIRFTP